MVARVLSPACVAGLTTAHFESEPVSQETICFVRKTRFVAVDALSGFAIMVSLPSRLFVEAVLIFDNS